MIDYSFLQDERLAHRSAPPGTCICWFLSMHACIHLCMYMHSCTHGIAVSGIIAQLMFGHGFCPSTFMAQPATMDTESSITGKGQYLSLCQSERAGTGLDIN